MFELHKEKLFAYLMRMGGDYELSRDILQETFRRYLEHYSGSDASPSLLYTIARNAFVDQVRRQARQTPLDEEPCDRGNGAEHEMLIRESYHGVLDALKALAADEREVLSLAISSELSYQEIAEVMNLTVANVKVKVHRARKRIREILKGGQQ